MKRNIFIPINILVLLLLLSIYYYSNNQRLTSNHELFENRSALFDEIAENNHQTIAFSYYNDKSKMNNIFNLSQNINNLCQNTNEDIDNLIKKDKNSSPKLLMSISELVNFPSQLYQDKHLQKHFKEQYRNYIETSPSYIFLKNVKNKLTKNDKIDLFELKLHVSSFNIDFSWMLLRMYGGQDFVKPELILLNNKCFDNNSDISFKATLGSIGFGSSFENNFSNVLVELFNKDQLESVDTFKVKHGIATVNIKSNNPNIDSMVVKYMHPTVTEDSLVYSLFVKSFKLN